MSTTEIQDVLERMHGLLELVRPSLQGAQKLNLADEVTTAIDALQMALRGKKER